MTATDPHSRRRVPRYERGAARAVLIAGCLAMVTSCAAAATALGASTIATAAAAKVVSYRGYHLTVPVSWPVYRLAQRAGTCVRFNRHAVYLGSPGADQRCPAHAVGRTEAILVSPLGADREGTVQTAARTLASARWRAALPPDGSGAELTEPAHHVIVTATWDQRPGLIRRALGVGLIAGAGAPARAPAAPAAPLARNAAAIRSMAVGSAATAIAGSEPGGVYTGVGFDACATPSSSQMSAWDASPYRAIGVYIGGTNMACAQPNLDSGWVTLQSAAGWHLVPIYVGLQAPSNSCGCAAISAGDAAAEGTAAANDAVVQAQAVGLRSGNPLYFDMEGYNPSAATSSAVLTFLSAWTSQLHAEGYMSGVYSSAASGIRDLARQVGSGYVEPDDIWIANWNGAASSADVNVPATDWPSHQRLHQYSGAHNETYAGVTINIDDDYLDGATAAAGTVTTAAAAGPSLSIAPVADGGLKLYPRWQGVSAVSSWQVVAGQTPSAMAPVNAPIGTATRMPLTLKSEYPYIQVEALASTGQTLGVSPATATPAHVAIFGGSIFVPRHGPAAVPVSCFEISACQITVTIASRKTLVRTGPEWVSPGGGLAYVSLSPAAHVLVADTSHRRLKVTVSARTSTGNAAARRLNLIPYTMTGRPPRRRIRSNAAVRILSATDFVAHGWTGGALAACLTPTPCSVSTTIVSGGQVIARTGAEFLGAGETGYLRFALTAAGHHLLERSHGNHLAARLDISDASTTATAAIVLSSFS